MLLVALGALPEHSASGNGWRLLLPARFCPDWTHSHCGPRAPERFYLLFTRPQWKSWLVRGAS